MVSMKIEVDFKSALSSTSSLGNLHVTERKRRKPLMKLIHPRVIGILWALSYHEYNRLCSELAVVICPRVAIQPLLQLIQNFMGAYKHSKDVIGALNWALSEQSAYHLS
jgi:hypothetical protein